MKISDVFAKAESGTMTYEQFAEAAKAGGANFVDVKEGGYVSTNKYQDELAAKDKQIELLNSTISTRNTDLESLKKQLEAAGADAGKLEELTVNLQELQTKYDGDTKAYKEQLKRQAYEFAVKEYANSKNFSSAAAKRDFTKQMIDKGLKMEGDKIIGADDFTSIYSQENSDAFVVETPSETAPSGIEPPVDQTIPQFVSSTSSGPQIPKADSNAFHFNFTGVRSMPAPATGN